jgi:hypothetical protein
LEIKNCDTYTLSSKGHECSKCKESYIISQGECFECNIGYYASKLNPEQCLECPSNCTKCREYENEIICIDCTYGYIILNGRCECDLDDFYILGDSCIVKPLKVDLYYDYNWIIISFNKQLASPLTASDFSIIFHQKFDIRLLTYEVMPIEGNYQYLISFGFLVNISKVFQISIIFSDRIVDRQNQKLKLKTKNTSLILEVIGILARSEYCNPSCSECEFINGRLECTNCYDYAYLFEDTCKCYVEDGDSNPESCPDTCPKGMIADSDLRKCVECENCATEYTENEGIDQEDAIKYYKNIASNISITAMVSAFAMGSVSKGEKLWSFVNTLQIYSYIPLINVKLPLYLQESMKSQDSTSGYFNHFKKYLPKDTNPFIKAVDFRYETTSLLRNALKPIMIFSVIFLLNILTYIIYRVSKGRLHSYSGIALNYFNLSVYLRHYIQLYMDILIPCALQLIYVIYI